MHTFGLPGRIQAIVAICDAWGIPVVEDAAESLGSWVWDGLSPSPPALPREGGGSLGWRHTGTFGRLGTLSFNGNKIITTLAGSGLSP